MLALILAAMPSCDLLGVEVADITQPIVLMSAAPRVVREKIVIRGGGSLLASPVVLASVVEEKNIIETKQIEQEVAAPVAVPVVLVVRERRGPFSRLFGRRAKYTRTVKIKGGVAAPLRLGIRRAGGG